MSQILYILFGWMLGLLSPAIIEYVKSKYRKREFVRALKVELEDLQYRLVVSSLSLLQSHGNLDKPFAVWALQTVDRYSGDEPNDGIRKFLNQYVSADDRTASELNSLARARDGVGASLKAFQAKFLESSLQEIPKLPIVIQRKIHELRYQINLLNQDVARSDSYMMMTFNSSLSSDNHEKVTQDLMGLYNLVQQRCKSAADKIASILLTL